MLLFQLYGKEKTMETYKIIKKEKEIFPFDELLLLKPSLDYGVKKLLKYTKKYEI